MPTARDAASRLYSLAARHGVGIGEACDRAGIARSTPSRWKAGTRARQSHVMRLRQAIMAIANERAATIGGGHGVTPGSIRNELASIRAACDRIEQALDQEGTAG